MAKPVLQAPDNGIPHRSLSGQLQSALPASTTIRLGDGSTVTATGKQIALMIATLYAYSSYNADGGSDKLSGHGLEMLNPALTTVLGGITYAGDSTHIIGKYDKGYVEQNVGDAPVSMRVVPQETLAGGRNIMQPGKIVAAVNGYTTWDAWHANMRTAVQLAGVNSRYGSSGSPYRSAWFDTMGPESTKGQKWWAGNPLGRTAGTVISDADWNTLGGTMLDLMATVLGADVYIALNGVRGGGTADAFAALASHADQAMWEGWTDYGIRSNLATRMTDAQFRTAANAALSCQQKGCNFEGLLYLPGTTVQAGGQALRKAQEYEVAVQLLASNDANGGGLTMQMGVGGNDPWVTGEMTNPLYLSFLVGGHPGGASRLGARTSASSWDVTSFRIVSDGKSTGTGWLYKKDYANGHVLLNTSSTLPLVSIIGAGYVDLFTGAAVASSLSVKPGEARFVIFASASAPVHTSDPVVSVATAGHPVAVGETLSCTPGAATGAPTPTPTYQWVFDDTDVAISGARSSSLVMTLAMLGHTIRCDVVWTNGVPPADGPVASNVLGPVTAINAPPSWDPTDLPVISGDATEGSTVTVSDGTVLGYPAPVVTYQWERSATGLAGSWTPISGATLNSFSIPAGWAGTWLRCHLTATNSSGTAKLPYVGVSKAGATVAPAGSDGVTLYLRWPDLEATDMGGTLNGPGLAAIASQISYCQTHNLQWKLRLFTNGWGGGTRDSGAPSWVKADPLVGTFRHLNSQDQDPAVDPAAVFARYWTARWKTLYTRFINSLGALIDAEPTLRDVTISFGMMLYAEPLILDLGDPENRAELIGSTAAGHTGWGTGTPANAGEVTIAGSGAGFTDALHMQALKDGIDAHAAAFPTTPQSFSFNPYQTLNGDGTFNTEGVALTKTKVLIDYLDAALGDRAVNENNSARPDYFTYSGGVPTGFAAGVYPALYQYFITKGRPVFIQTANTQQITNTAFPSVKAATDATMLAVMTLLDACGCEPPESFASFESLAEIDAWSLGLAANAPTVSGATGVANQWAAKVGPVTGPPIIAPSNATLPAISYAGGQTQPLVGRPCYGSAGTWNGTTPMSFAYQWRRCDLAGASCIDIPGATGQTYTPVAADVGHTLRLRVTATNAGGTDLASSPFQRVRKHRR